MSRRKASNIQWHESLLTRDERWDWLRARGATLWMTGLPSSGKSTLATVLERVLVLQGVHVFRLDGDNIRHGLNADLGFSREERQENIRRIAEVARLFAESGCLAITAFISPYREDRDAARELHEQIDLPFFEIFVDAPLEVCERRDPRGLYRKARAGELKEFTGVSDPYEAPLAPELIVKTAEQGVEPSAMLCLDLLARHGFVRDRDCVAAIEALRTAT